MLKFITNNGDFVVLINIVKEYCKNVIELMEKGKEENHFDPCCDALKKLISDSKLYEPDSSDDDSD